MAGSTVCRYSFNKTEKHITALLKQSNSAVYVSRVACRCSLLTFTILAGSSYIHAHKGFKSGCQSAAQYYVALPPPTS